MDLDRYRAAGLYDPDAANAADQRRLLQWLEDHEVSFEQMRRSARADSLWSAAGDAAVRPGRPITLDELCATVGITPERVHEVLLASGATAPAGEEPTFTENDLATSPCSTGAWSCSGPNRCWSSPA